MVSRHKYALAGWIIMLVGFFALIDFIFYTGELILAWRFWVWIWSTRFGRWGRS